MTSLELAGSRWLRVFDILEERDDDNTQSLLAQLARPIPKQARAARDALTALQATLTAQLAALRTGATASATT